MRKYLFIFLFMQTNFAAQASINSTSDQLISVNAYKMQRDLDKSLEKIRDIRQETYSDGYNDAESLAVESEGNDQSIELLEGELTKVLARPDIDHARNNLSNTIRNELKNYSAFEPVLARIAGRAVGKVKNQGLPLIERITALEILDNILAEYRPESKTNAKVKTIFTQIYKADIQIDEDLKDHRALLLMVERVSPSENARIILGLEKKSSGWFW